MPSAPAAVHMAREYNMGFIWAAAAFLLLLVIMAWFAGSNVFVVDRKLAVFLLWLHVVPVGGLSLHRTLT